MSGRPKSLLQHFSVINENAFKIDKSKGSFESIEDSYRTAIIEPNLHVEYFEVQLLSFTGACRVGFGTKECELNGPLGVDKQGFSYGSANGYKFHNSVRNLCGPRLRKGDVVSCRIYKSNPENDFDPSARHIASLLTGCVSPEIIYESTSNSNQVVDKPIYGRKSVAVKFYVNGQETYGGFLYCDYKKLYPTISLYGGCKVRADFGPMFAYLTAIENAIGCEIISIK